MKQKLRGECIDAGVDWITVTAKDQAKCEQLRAIAYGLIETQLGIGNFGRPWFQSGYVGVACGHVQFGERDDGVILRLGGYVAKDYWMRVVEFADNITRIDLQGTFRTEELPVKVVHRHYREIQRKRRLFKKAPRLSRICDDDGGYTVYSGRRTSDVMGRIYDKETQSKVDRFKSCVRYEVQFSGKRARLVAIALARSSVLLTDIARSVLEWFSTRGLLVQNLLGILTQTTSIDISRPAIDTTDTERKLEWLLKSVRPSVVHLITRGLRDRVLTILGINEQFSTEAYSTA